MNTCTFRIPAVAVATLLLSACASQSQRPGDGANPFCLLVGAAAGGGTAAALGAAAGPIGAGIVAGAMFGSLFCPKAEPVEAVAVTPTVAPPPASPAPPAPPPVLDSDGDGIVDGDDRCPDTPRGTPVGADGCPDILLTLTGINFAFDRADIQPNSAILLDDAVKTLNRYEGVDVRIEGHTDSVGSEAYNLLLSQRRADAVRDYLVRQGIPASRLSTSGMGEARPVAPNETAEGRFQNRRVEFHAVRPDGSTGGTAIPMDSTSNESWRHLNQSVTSG